MIIIYAFVYTFVELWPCYFYLLNMMVSDELTL